MRTFITLGLLTTIIGGCATKPIPENFAKLSTFDIVQKIRCEAQSALRTIVIETVASPRYGNDGDLARLLKSRKKSFKTALDEDLPKLNRRTRALINRYRLSAVAYGFTFDITENNNTSGSVNFLDVITGGTFKLGLSAQNNIARQNQRTFNISDTFEDLVVNNIIHTDCLDPGDLAGTQYPIKGNLGLGETFQTYFNLDAVATMSAIGKPDSKASTTPVFSDTMTFTTEVVGELNPSITLTTGVTNITLGDAKIGAKLVRKDSHKLLLTLAIPKGAEKIDFDSVAEFHISLPLTPEERGFQQSKAREAAESGIPQTRELLFQQNAVLVSQ